MNKKRIASRLVFAGGVVELLIAVLHFVMPAAINQSAEIAGLSFDYRNYVFLATIAIGMCMMIFGTLSIYFSGKMAQGEQAAWAFSLSQAILWAGRFVAELILPVRIQLFFLSKPTIILLPLIAGIVMLFLIPTLLLSQDKAYTSVQGA